METDKSSSILAPRLDVLFSGALSIALLIALSIVGILNVSTLPLQDFLILTILINGTHFMASYRLLYSSLAFANRYPWASYYVPGFLVTYTVTCFCLLSYYPNAINFLQALTAVATLYLALHYTGQCWGMVSSFAFLEGIRFEPKEKTLLRRTISFMALWHFIWALKLLWNPSSEYSLLIKAVDIFMNSLAVIALLAGLLCFGRVSKRICRPIPLRIVSPYLALFVWYGFLYFFPSAIFWVQISHALQYLPFPLRVEINRVSMESPKSNAGLQAAVYFLTLTITSLAIFGAIPHIATSIGTGAYNGWVALAAIINIHHYYIDGCIWRISNPVVSEELFSHTTAR